MCGRYSLETTYEQFGARYGIKESMANFTNKPEIFPTQLSFILKDNKIFTGKWGISKVINARLESVDQKPLFKKSWHYHRCLIPATSFFEWDKNKQKYKVKQEGTSIFSLAGLYRIFDNQLEFVILTKESNESLSGLHHRMPVVVPPKYELAYLNNNHPSDKIKEICSQSNPTWVYHQV